MGASLDMAYEAKNVAESQARQLDPTFTGLQVAPNVNDLGRATTYARDFISEYQKRKEAGQAIGESVRDLQSQIRSEIGEDGGETYFESYIGTVYCGLVNYITNRIEYQHWVIGSASNYGLLGSNELTYTLGSTRFNESNAIQDLDETFNTTTYQDASTTASGWGTGSLVFTTSGSLGVFSNWKSGSFYQTEFNKIRIDPTFTTYNPAVVFQASFNGGSNYTIIYPLIESTISPVGSDFRLKITDTSGSINLSNIYITTKGEGFA